MKYISYFSPVPDQDELPEDFPSPFVATPHPLAMRASEQLQQSLQTQTDWQHDFDKPDGGKMFGVLVVRDGNNQLGFLSAFSGMLAGQWLLPGFVPPVFDLAERDAFLPAGESKLADYAGQIQALQQSNERQALQIEIEQLSKQRDLALAALKETKKIRKSQRQQQRIIGQSLMPAERELLLTRLSFLFFSSLNIFFCLCSLPLRSLMFFLSFSSLSLVSLSSV